MISANTQPGLLQAGPSPRVFQPLEQAPYHYVPVLQDRAGERDALAHMPVGSWARVTPLMVIVGPRGAAVPSRTLLASRARRIAEVLRGHNFYVDLLRLPPTRPVVDGRSDVTVLDYLYDRLRGRGARFMPVVPLDASQRLSKEVGLAAKADGRGAALRVALGQGVLQSTSSLQKALRHRLGAATLVAEEVDLILDMGFIPPDVPVDTNWVLDQVTTVHRTARWRNIVLLGTSMPQTLGMINEGSMGAIPRREWEIWEAARTRLGPVACYGDYAIQHPKPPEETGPGMRANIRYTMPNRTVVVRGEGPVTQGLGSLQYQDLARQLVGLPDFSTRDCSWGDGTIELCAGGGLPRSSQHTWRGAGTSHHIEIVCALLADRSA